MARGRRRRICGYIFISKKGWVDYNFAMIEALDDARAVISDAATRNDVVSLRDYETSDGIKRVESENNLVAPLGNSRTSTLQDHGFLFIYGTLTIIIYRVLSQTTTKGLQK